MPFFKGTSSQRCTFSLLCNSLCFPSIRVKIWEVWISPAVPLGFYVHTDARKFSPVYKFCRIRTQVFLRLSILYLLDLLSAFPYSYRALTCLVVLPIPSSFCSLGYMFASDIFQISPCNGHPCYCPCNSRY